MRDAKAPCMKWKHAVELHEKMTGLLATAVASQMTIDTSEDGQSMNDMALLNCLNAINSCLSSEAVHGHLEFIALCEEKLPVLLADWSGERPWIVEVGCAREMIEGQTSSMQLLALAKRLKLSFTGIDLDHKNIESLELDPNEFNATWIMGKGEEALKNFNKPIVAIYLNAYDVWNTNYSEQRPNLYNGSDGSGINDADCQKMHLEAARQCSSHILPGGLIGLGDTWLRNGEWEGRGKLAIPWLLDRGWHLLSNANQATTLFNAVIDE